METNCFRSVGENYFNAFLYIFGLLSSMKSPRICIKYKYTSEFNTDIGQR